MAGRIIIKPFVHHEINGGNMETGGATTTWTARPEFNYIGMPALGKPHFGKGLTPWEAVRELAKYLPKDLRDILSERKEEEIYPRPDCEIYQQHKVLEMDGFVPDKNEWTMQKAWYIRRGDLRSYFKMKEEKALLDS